MLPSKLHPLELGIFKLDEIYNSLAAKNLLNAMQKPNVNTD